MNRTPCRFGRWVGAAALLASVMAVNVPAAAQFKILESFTGATAPGWTLSNDAALTAPTVDPVGSGWLRLTPNANSSRGTALYTGGSFAGAQPIAARFRYVAWGGSGADGITFFLYDSTQNMSGALAGGSLGYCGGAGGYLAVGLDEFGNFSSNNSFVSDLCAAAGGGPGPQPDRFVIRGPLSAGNVFVTNAPVAAGIDVPFAASRPVARIVTLSLVPAVMGPGYSISARYQDSPTGAVQTLFSNVPFPYAAPATLSVGFSGSTGGATNFHEVQSLAVATANDVGVTISGPVSVVEGASATYDVVVTNIGPAALSGTNAPTVATNFPATLAGLTWTCTGSAGASCPAAGTGNINTSTLTLPVGGSVTFRFTGTAAPSASCGASTLQPSAAVDFSDSALYLDPDLTNNTAQASTALQCADTTPEPFSFTPVTGVAPSSVQTSNSITVTGTNAPAPISIVGGEYSINGGPFTSTPGTVPPGATVVVRQTASPNFNTTTTATLTIGGVSAPFDVTTAAADTTPNTFSFTPVTGVAPSSVQTSNSITVTGTNAPAPISIVGGEYSINGGPFTSTPGTVPPGATVVVRQTASPNFNTTTTATLTIGGVSAPFAATTRVANPGVLQFSAPTYTGSGANPSVTVTVTRTGGTDGAVSANVVDAQGNVVGTVNFGNGVGGSQNVVIPLSNAAGGATLQLRIVPVSGGATVGTIGNATVTITAAPLEGFMIKSRDGGGSMSPLALLLIGCILAWRLARWRRRAVVVGASVLLVSAVGVFPVQAEEPATDRKDRREKLYYGLRAGYSMGELSSGEVTRELQALGYNVTADVEKDQPAGAVYIGYEWRRQWAIEASYAYMGRTYTNVTGTTPRDFDRFVQDALDTTEGAGEAISLSVRYQWEWTPRIGVDFRVGGYRYKNRQTVCFDDERRLTRIDKGGGETFGITPRFRWRDKVDLGVSIDYFRSTDINRFWHGALTIEYHPDIDK